MDDIKRAQAIVDEAKFPNAEIWNKALQDGDPYAFATVLISRIRNIMALQLDYSFVWMSGFPGLMLRHAIFSAPQGLLSMFNSLVTVDYGGNVRLSDQLEELGIL